VGKTTLLHALAQQNLGSMTVARVQQPSVTPEELVNALAEQFRLPPQESAGREATARLTRFVAEENGQRALGAHPGRRSAPLFSVPARAVGPRCRQPAPFIVLAGETGLLASLAALEAQGVRCSWPYPAAAPLSAEQIEGYLTTAYMWPAAPAAPLFDPDTTPSCLRLHRAGRHS